MGQQDPGAGVLSPGPAQLKAAHTPSDPSFSTVTQQPIHPTPIQAQLHLLGLLGDSGTLETYLPWSHKAPQGSLKSHT